MREFIFDQDNSIYFFFHKILYTFVNQLKNIFVQEKKNIFLPQWTGLNRKGLGFRKHVVEHDF